jgi:hypothetical protein
MEAGKIHVKLGSGLVRNPATGVISFDAGVLPADVHVQGMSWNPATNELTLTESDGSTHVVSLATLAADKFLQASSYNPATNTLTLTMTDGSTYTIDLSDLVQANTSGGIQGDGTTGNEIRPDFDTLPENPEDNVATTDFFVMSTSDYPDGARVTTTDAGGVIFFAMINDGSIVGPFQQILSVDVQDAFGTHLYYALP